VKRLQLRRRRPGVWLSKGSQRTTSPVAGFSVSVERSCGWPPFPRSIAKTAGWSGDDDSRRLMPPAGNLLLGARPQRIQSRRFHTRQRRRLHPDSHSNRQHRIVHDLVARLNSTGSGAAATAAAPTTDAATATANGSAG
jgi:hypothetical protein